VRKPLIQTSDDLLDIAEGKRQEGSFRWVTTAMNGSRLPEWQRTAAMDKSGEVYLPALASGHSANEVWLCASFDGVGVLTDEKEHRYYPASWLAAEFRAGAADIARIVGEVRKVLAEDH